MSGNDILQKKGLKPRKLYILVMGLTGAGKSTFISILTENQNIPMGEAAQMHRVTREVQDYILCYQHEGKPYEVHLIDSPGFDDDYARDADVLSSMATYMNTNYMLKQRLGGVLYLHDITKAKMGGVGRRNIRMLEQMIGLEKLNNCTIVTTKWGCTTSPQDEALRENTLREDTEFFGSMLQNEQPHRNAIMQRFDPKNKDTALDIIKRYLEKEFTPHISEQMVSPMGPKLPLDETEPGKVVADNLKKLAQSNIELDKVKAAQAVLSQKYDMALFEEFKQKRTKLRRQIRLQKSGRWIMRTTIVGGAIVATVVTLGPGAAAFELEPLYEKSATRQKINERNAKVRLEEEFERKAKDASRLKVANPQWLWDSKVHTIQDLDKEGYNTESFNPLEIAKRGETVGFAVDEGVGGKGNVLMGKEIDWDSESTSGDDGSNMGD